jgi:hypothetical protein
MLGETALFRLHRLGAYEAVGFAAECQVCQSARLLDFGPARPSPSQMLAQPGVQVPELETSVFIIPGEGE